MQSLRNIPGSTLHGAPAPRAPLLVPALAALGLFVLGACGPHFLEPYAGPGKLPGTWYHEVAGFSDFPYINTYEFRAGGSLRFSHEDRKYETGYSWTGTWELRGDSLIASMDSCGIDPAAGEARSPCPLPFGYDVGWDPAARRVYQKTENGPLFLTYKR